jgi:hypothetical protein
MQLAVGVHGRHHEYQHVARHHPLRDRLFEVLQVLAAQADRAGFRMKDAGGNADSQGAPHEISAEALAQGAPARTQHASGQVQRRVAIAQIAGRSAGGAPVRDARRTRSFRIFIVLGHELTIALPLARTIRIYRI